MAITKSNYTERNYSGYVPSENRKEYSNQIVDSLTEGQILELDKEINENYNGFKKAKDIKDFLFSKGAVNRNGEVRIEGLKFITIKGEPVVDCDPINFEMWQNRLNQWRYWLSKRQRIEAKKIEGLEEVAESFRVKDEW